MTLKKLRNKIDIVDKKIVNLLAERLKLVKRTKSIKEKRKFDLEDILREKVIFENVKKRAEEKGLNTDFILKLFKEIINHYKKIQKVNL